MNKSQLVEAIAEKAEVSKVYAKKCMDAFVAISSETLRSGEKITISGFGSFVITRTPTRVGRNFRTGCPVEIPARMTIKFRPSFDGH